MVAAAAPQETCATPETAHDRDGDGALQYAQRLPGAPGKHDGLHWPADAAKGDGCSPAILRYIKTGRRRPGRPLGRVIE